MSEAESTATPIATEPAVATESAVATEPATAAAPAAAAAAAPAAAPAETVAAATETVVMSVDSDSKAASSTDTDAAAKPQKPKRPQTENRKAKVELDAKIESGEIDLKTDVEMDATKTSRIVGQMEFYFSDVNMPRDRYMMSLHTSCKDNFIPLTTFMRFKRILQITTDVRELATALRTSEELTLSEDCRFVKRKSPLPTPEEAQEQDQRTLYVKGFPKDAEKTSIESVRAFFEPHGKVQAVRLRRYPDSTLKGSMFVVFETKEVPLSLLNQELKLDDVVLEKMMKQDFIQEKKDQARERRKRKKDGQPDADKKERGPIPQDCLLRLSGLPAAELNHDQIRSPLRDLSEPSPEVAFVDYDQGSTTCVVRVRDNASAAALVALIGEKGLKIDDTDIQAAVIGGDEEIAYWTALRSKPARRVVPPRKRRR
jgi:lupus La protein